MSSLWTRIGVGAVGVFAVGMVGIAGFHHAADSVARKLHDFAAPAEHNSAVDEVVTPASAQAAAPMARLAGLRNLLPAGHGTVDHEMSFRLDGHTIGTIRRMVIQRNTRGEIPAMNITVDLDSDLATTALSHCDMLLAIDHGDGVDSGFRCAESDAPGTTAVGWARFEPGGETRPIAVTSRETRDLRSGDPFKVTVDADGQVDVSADGKDGLVRIQANDNGANIRINDGLGKAIFGLLADSNGAQLHVRGKHGKDIVRMQAGDGGFSLVVDTSAAH
jgi:hypothetical protein